MPTKRIQVVERVFELLECFSAQEPDLGVTELSAKLGQPKSSVHRLLVTLLDKQIVSFDERTQRYSLGPGLARIVSNLLNRLNIQEISRPFLASLRDDSGETAVLTLRTGLERMYIDQVESRNEVRITVETGKLLPLYAGAGGRAILAWLSEEQVLQVIRQSGLQSITPTTITDHEAFLAEQNRVRKDGFALSAGERVFGSTSISVPILNQQGSAIGAIGLSGPSARFTPGDARVWAPRLKQAASEITRSLFAVHSRPMKR